MKYTIQSFFHNFYGSTFARYFRRIPEFEEPKIHKQFTVETPKQLYLHIHRNNGIYPCYLSIYNYTDMDDLKYKKTDNLLFDRVFFDFDVTSEDAYKIKVDLKKLREYGNRYKQDKQIELKNQLRELVIDCHIAADAFEDAKTFAHLIKRDFGKEPALFFSGFKGCHAYIFFEPLDLTDPNETIKHFATEIKHTYKLQTMDLSVNINPLSRVSRIPYTQHQFTDLTVVPFKSSDKYTDVMQKALNPQIEIFRIENHHTTLDNHLKIIDEIINHNSKIKSPHSKSKLSSVNQTNSKLNMDDQRIFFKQILNEPIKEYMHYNMYRCPFPDHEDLKPSFMVHKKGYKCYGCSRKGNYWDFLKNYYNWTDNQVRKYLKSA